MAHKRIRPYSEVTSDLEKVLEEMTDPKGHDLQWHEVLHDVLGWLEVHAPHAQETYVDGGGHPVFFYGPKEKLK